MFPGLPDEVVAHANKRYGWTLVGFRPREQLFLLFISFNSRRMVVVK